MIEIHTTRERKRNASATGGLFGNPRANKLALMGGALAGGGATLLVAEKAGLSPVWAGAATGGLALAGSALLPSPQLKDACFAAGLGGIGVAGVQLLAGFYAKQKQDAQKTHDKPSSPPAKRQADGDAPSAPFVTRDELNSALAQIADKHEDQHKETCDLMTALHAEIKKVVTDMQPASTKQPAPFLYPLTSTPRAPRREDGRNAFAEDDYMRNAYGDEDERNADLDDERNAFADEYERNAYGDADDRNAEADEQRNGDEDERNGDSDEERNAGDDERDASGYDSDLM